MSETEERVDGRELKPLRELGSDDRLGEEAKARIVEWIRRHWNDDDDDDDERSGSEDQG